MSDKYVCLRYNARRRAIKNGTPIPAWAQLKHRDPLEKPEGEPTVNQIGYCREVARKRGVPIPEWAAIKKRKAMETPKGKPTDSQKHICRAAAKKRGLPVPEWAKLEREKVPKAGVKGDLSQAMVDAGILNRRPDMERVVEKA